MDQVGDVCRCDCHITYLDNTVKKDCYCSCNGLKIIKDKMPMNKWISFNEHLPNIGDKVLAKSGDEFIKESVFKGDIFFVEPCFEMTDVTHWMPLKEDE